MMKYIYKTILFSSLFLISINIFASNYTDSLLIKLEKVSPQQQIDIRINLAEELIFISPELARSHAEIAYKTAVKFKAYEKQIISLNLIGQSYANESSFLKAIDKLKTATAIAQKFRINSTSLFYKRRI